jgi:hypothetical protein
LQYEAAFAFTLPVLLRSLTAIDVSDNNIEADGAELLTRALDTPRFVTMWAGPSVLHSVRYIHCVHDSQVTFFLVAEQEQAPLAVSVEFEREQIGRASSEWEQGVIWPK